jgi:hypothetical protein
MLDDLVALGLRTPEFLIIDGAAGLEEAVATLWPAVPTQRCTVHKHGESFLMRISGSQQPPLRSYLTIGGDTLECGPRKLPASQGGCA